MLASLYGKLTVTFNSRQWKQEAEIPRNGAGVASPVPGFNTVAASTTILSALHNSGINDIFTILNSAWPVSLGGTGGTTAISSWDAITAKGTDIASASTVVLTTATGPRIDITGTTAITAVTLANGSMRIARATGIFVLTASASLIVNKSTSVNYTTAVGDLMIFTAEGSVTSVTVIGSSSSSNTTSNASFTNFAIGTPTVAASALTIPFTGLDGNALGANNVAYINFRSSTAGSGAVTQLTLNSALASLVISSGSTLGMTSGVATTLALAIFNDAGTPRPAIINPTTLPLVDGIASATSEGGAGAADSAGVWYSNAAITAKAYTIVGFITVTEATAGTWATAPSVAKVDIASAVNNALPAARNGLVLLTSGTVASAATLDIVLTGYAAYRQVLLVGNFYPVSDNNTLVLRTSTDGTTFAITGYASRGSVFAGGSTNMGTNIGGNSDSIPLTGPGVNNTTARGCFIMVEIPGPGSSSRSPIVMYDTIELTSGDSTRHAGYGNHNTSAETLAAIRLLFSSGNISSGNYALYGYL